METNPDESVQKKMESLRLACDREVSMQQHNLDTLTASTCDSLASIRATLQETLQFQGKVEEAKAKLREAEDDLSKALADKTHKEAKRIALAEAIAVRKAGIEQIKKTVQDRRAKRDEYAAFLSQQSLESEEKCNQDSKGETQEAISWYNRVLALHIEGGEGVKFTFKNISLNNPDEEFSFVVRLATDTYSLSDCHPHLTGTKELIDKLNGSSDLFRFIREMRLKFQEAAAEDSSTIVESAPVLAVPIETSESAAKNYEQQVQYDDTNRHFKKPKLGKGRSTAVILSPESASSVGRSSHFQRNERRSKPAILSPESALSVRRSPRFQVKK